MPTRINRQQLHHLANTNPYASYADLAELMNCAQATVSRIMRNEFGMVRNPRFTVLEDFCDFRRWRQRLVGESFFIEPVNGDGKGQRVAR